jgi:hypothetical protein
MTRDLEPSRKPPAPGRLVVTGVVGACVLGVGLGFWARPTAPGAEAKPSRAAAPLQPTRPTMQIVLEDAPAPIGVQLEVLPSDVRAPPAAPPAPQPVEPMAPRRAASGLVRVDTVVLPDPAPAPAIIHAPPTHRAEPPQALKLVIAEPPRPDPKAGAKARMAEAKARKAAELARAEKQERAKAAQLAKAEQQAKAAKLEMARLHKARFEKARLEKTRLEKARLDSAKATKLAKAQASRDRDKAERFAKAEKASRLERAAGIEKAKVEAKAKRLALLKAVKAEARQILRPKAVKVAAVKPVPKAAVAAPARKPAPKPALRGSGPMRVARAAPCSPDPGEAAVCADQRLGARDRQLQQAYRNAEAAGVPASALRLQQARWLQARAAAAREAPWAVEDVYVARISELKDQTRDAREN